MLWNFRSEPVGSAAEYCGPSMTADATRLHPELSRPSRVQPAMTTHPFKSALAVLALLFPLAAAAAKQEETFKLLVEEKGVTFSLKLVDADLKAPVKDHKEDGVPTRPNLKIVKQLDVTLLDARDNKRILGILGFAVGEKDGKLLLVREAPAK